MDRAHPGAEGEGLIDCSTHGEQPTESHHILPRSRGGTDDPDNLEDLCRECHRDLHRVDRDMHYPGWLGLREALGDELSQHMGRINRPYLERLRRDLGEDGYRKHMSRLGKAGNERRWGNRPSEEAA